MVEWSLSGHPAYNYDEWEGSTVEMSENSNWVERRTILTGWAGIYSAFACIQLAARLIGGYYSGGYNTIPRRAENIRYLTLDDHPLDGQLDFDFWYYTLGNPLPHIAIAAFSFFALQSFYASLSAYERVSLALILTGFASPVFMYMEVEWVSLVGAFSMWFYMVVYGTAALLLYREKGRTRA